MHTIPSTHANIYHSSDHLEKILCRSKFYSVNECENITLDYENDVTLRHHQTMENSLKTHGMVSGSKLLERCRHRDRWHHGH